MFVAMCNGVELFAVFLLYSQKVVQRVHTMFLLQVIDGVEPFVDVFQTFRIELDLFRASGNLAGKVFQFDVTGLHA